MPDDCIGAAVNENYRDFISGFRTSPNELRDFYHSDCITQVNFQYAIVYVDEQQAAASPVSNFSGNAIPRCYGLMDMQVLEETGAAQVRRSGLDLTGQGVLAAVIDTGIDYTNTVFQLGNQTTKIQYIWDQTIQGEDPPMPYGYGTEYTKEQIDEALQAENPLEIVPSQDTSGHGTFLAGMIAGNEVQEENFSGIAPGSELVVVKLKQAKSYLKEYYCIDPSKGVHSEPDIMLAIRYVLEKADELNMPVVIYLGLGTNLSSHTGTSPLARQISALAYQPGIAIIVTGGNEGQAKHHYAGALSDGEVVVEIKVGPGEYGFTAELWGFQPNQFFVDIESPSGQRTGVISGGYRGRRNITFLLEQTSLIVDYFTIDVSTGSPFIRMRFRAPAEGVWKVHVTDENVGSREFDMWLPIRNFITDETYFLESTPYNTLTAPGNAAPVITPSTYNQSNNSFFIESGRGYPRTMTIQPDFAAPGVNVIGVLPRNRFGMKTGASISGSVVAGLAALLLEWGQVKENDLIMNTLRLKNYLIRGARRDPDRNYPNREWGFGAVDVYQAFLRIR